MKYLKFDTRQDMRTFVKRVNLCTGKKLFKNTGGRDGCGSWLANKVIINDTLQAPSKPVKLQSSIINLQGKEITITHKRSVKARMALKA